VLLVRCRQVSMCMLVTFAYAGVYLHVYYYKYEECRGWAQDK
jgi:hypothetical protein